MNGQIFRKMRCRWMSATCAGLAAIILCFPHLAARAQAPANQTLVEELRLNGEVEPILATYIEEGLADAAKRHAGLVLITMDTPGGLSDSMKDIIQHILDSPVPVAVYVSPVGARGASAGFYILLAADVAAMAPGTHTGAASPIISVGGFPQKIDEVFRQKLNNDALAFLRSFTEKRMRNTTLAETAISDAKAFTDQEALNGKLIDMVAPSTEQLLRDLNGRTITRFDGNRVKLQLADPVRTAFALSARQRFLARILEPDIFFILLIVGVLGLYTEFTHPGVIAPGVVGGICMVLALYAMQFLPVNLAGLALIFLALAFFALEAKYASHGVLTLGGLVALILGAMFLVRSPLTNGGVSFSVALAVAIPFAFITVFLMRMVLRSRKWSVKTGREELIGEVGTVVAPVGAGQDGMIRVHGELWGAASSSDIAKGKPVKVIRVEGLKLYVEPFEIEITGEI